MARILIVGGGSRGLQLTQRLVQDGHAVRVTTRKPERRRAIEAAGAECFIGTPQRLATLRAALENVTIACWLLAAANGAEEQAQALHGSRLEFFLSQIIDTTIRGMVYDASSCSMPAELMAAGAQTVRRMTARNSIPSQIIETDGSDDQLWQRCAHAAICSLLD